MLPVEKRSITGNVSDTKGARMLALPNDAAIDLLTAVGPLADHLKVNADARQCN